MADEGTAAGEIIEIELGFDPMRAHLIHEACRAEGFQVGLRLMDQNGQTPLMHPLVPHRLMVREGDVEHVYEIVERTMPSEVGDEGPVKARWTLRRFSGWLWPS